MTYAQRWKDFPEYIISITKEIWEERQIDTLRATYAPGIVVRTPMGIARGNEAVIASTMATLHEFPDRQLLADDVIWSTSDAHGHLSSHRILSTGTHLAEGAFGPATGRPFAAYVLADCAADGPAIYDEWLVRDQGGIVRQLGHEPRTFAAGLIAAEGGPQRARRPFTPDQDIDGGYHGRGNDNAWGARYAELLTQIMQAGFGTIHAHYDRAVQAIYPGGVDTAGRDASAAFWLGLRASFTSAAFTIHHVIGMDGDMLSPRAAIRWSLDGAHEGWGAFGRPTGAHVHVMGISHAEFGPWGLRREYALYDEVAIWKQILLHTGDA